MSDKPVLTITEEMVQELAESNLGRKLTEVELSKVILAMVDDSSVVNERDEFILEAIRCGVMATN